MRSAADKQDQEDSGDFTVPGREMLADMLMELHQPAQALAEYESLLKISPNRFNDLYGAASAAQMAGDSKKARSYYSKLRETCPPAADRPELRNVPFAAGGPAELEKRQQRFTPTHHASDVEEGVCSR
jgi:tetratricopeptide (TPR) repeat protein